MKRIIIVGGGFAGLGCARLLAGERAFDVLLIDRRNHHVFQPLLYQVAMAGLLDKGQLATIGRSRALLQSGPIRLAGFVAWCAWLVVHIYYLSGFPNRLLVLIQWAWSYVTFARGARLIVDKSWRSYPESHERPRE
ncbi:MAG: FAD-dependent oxidoreductase [Polyangiaceae bacterium]|nr:FAD-dependent oxidoreductase [Polyangiaceae bacterium]